MISREDAIAIAVLERDALAQKARLSKLWALAHKTSTKIVEALKQGEDEEVLRLVKVLAWQWQLANRRSEENE